MLVEKNKNKNAQVNHQAYIGAMNAHSKATVTITMRSDDPFVNRSITQAFTD